MHVPNLQALFRAPEGVKPKAPAVHRTPFSFAIPPASDASILLGNRYLNRGDGLILSSSSGMGKSSMSHQMASDWALGKPFHGIAPNGSLRILIIQAEDSDGDIAEVWQSLQHIRQYTDAERATLDRNIRIVSERSLRGVKFIAWLGTEIADFSPDLVILNPLQAYIDGDVTDSKDLGFFLREGLNGLNRDARFGYLIVHHTTKPATGKDRSERLWHEVMYDMAGGAEIINWARAIISLRATETPGVFKAVLAKRGRRAGITRTVEQGAGTRQEPVTEIGLQHAQGKIPGTSLGLICWEGADIKHAPKQSTGAGRRKTHSLDDYLPIFPPTPETALGFRPLMRAAQEISPSMGVSTFERLIDEALDCGLIVKDKSNPRQPRYHLAVQV